MIHWQWLKIDKVDMRQYALANGVSVWTDQVDTHFSKGNAAIVVDLHSGDIDITFQNAVGLDKKFYDIEDIDKNDLTKVYTNLTADKWIVYDPMLAGRQRFKFTANADSNFSVKYVQQD